MDAHRRHRILIIAGYLLANGVLMSMAYFFLEQSRNQYEQRAETRSRTLALAIDQNVSETVRRIDLTLCAVVDELERQLATGGLEHKSVVALLGRHEGRLPDVEAIRVTNSEGLVTIGKGIANGQPVNLGDRPYFRAVRDNSRAGLQMSDPIVGRIVGKWIVTFVRRYNAPDGSFAGIVSAPIPLDTFSANFARFDAGPRGIIGLRAADLSLLVRQTRIATGEGAEAPGSQNVSAQMKAVVASGVAEGTYHARVAFDGLQRVTTLRRLAGVPLIVTVGIAADDYLDAWVVERDRTWLLVIAFALASAVMVFLLFRSGRDALVAEDRNRLFLDSASDGICVLDEFGSVVEANRRFAEMLGYSVEELLCMSVVNWDAQWDAETLLGEILPQNFTAQRDATFETLHRRRDGAIYHAEVTVRFFAMEGRQLAFCASRDITEKKRQSQALEETAQRLRESELRLQTIIEAEPECVKVVALDGTITQMNLAGLQMLEADSLAQLRGMKALDIVAPEHREAFVELSRSVAAGNSGILEFEAIGLKGSRRWLESHLAPLRDGSGKIAGVLGVTRDITDRKRADENQRLAAAIFKSTREGIVLTDLQGTILAVNPAYTEITGYGEAEVVGGKANVLRSSHHDERFYAAMWKSLAERGAWQGEIWNRRKNGEIYPQWMTISSVYDERGQRTSYVGVFSDISRIKESEAEMEFLAHHDVLTSLPNRLLVISRIESAVVRAERNRSQGAVLFIDLDRFKHVNDSLGHPAGDEVLCLVARRLHNRLREIDTLARLGGDEFVALLEDLHSPEDAASVAQALIDQLRAPFELTCGHTVYLGCSIGISMYPVDSMDPQQLVQFADTALYQAKAQGRGTLHFYTDALGQKAARHLALESALQQALTRDEFIVHYQPLMDIEKGVVVGVEALVRWLPPGEQPVAPDRFIPHAEETGLIVPIGGWVLRRACAQVGAWRRAGLVVETLAVNVSPRQLLNPNLADEIVAVLADSELPPGVLELEITENAILELGEDARERLASLKARGIRLAIDDFGTGYSSLAYLKHFQVNKLKIDRSFVADIPGSRSDQEIVGTIIAMARNLGLEALAEGVETVEQRDFLVAHGCRLAQGYFFSRPLSPEGIPRLLAGPSEAHSGCSVQAPFIS